MVGWTSFSLARDCVGMWLIATLLFALQRLLRHGT